MLVVFIYEVANIITLRKVGSTMKKINNILMSLIIALSITFSTGMVAFASETPKDNSMKAVEEQSLSSFIYEDAGTFNEGYKGITIPITSSGNYKIYYCIKGVTSTNDIYTFAVNNKQITVDENATGVSHVTGSLYYNANSNMTIGIHGVYGRTYAYSILVDKL